MQRTCLFCDDPATSLEHFFPQGLGGIWKIPILCPEHNRFIGNHCDEPLVESMSFFVHALRIKRADGRGIPIKGIDANGKEFVVDTDHKPQLPGVEIIERTPDNRPSKAAAPTEKQVKKLLKSMGVDPSDAIFVQQTEPPPTLNFSLQLGGVEAFRGVLKIAYEFVRGYLESPSIDALSEAKIHEAILEDGDTHQFVRWLPYEMLPGGDEFPEFSSRIAAWYDGDETLVIVEFFNCIPFVVRLPGIAVSRPELYIQSVHGGDPATGTMNPPPAWHFSDVPAHAQPLMMAEFEKRVQPILKTMQAMMYVVPIATSIGKAYEADANATEQEFIDEARRALEAEVGRALSEAERKMCDDMVSAILPMLGSKS